MFLVAVLWTLYGYLLENLFIFLPNFICSIIAAVQLLLFLIFPNTPSSPTKKGD